VPASIAAERFQAHERFVPGLTPELSGALETGLVLSAGRFHRSTAQWFAALAGRSVVQPITMGLQVVDFFSTGSRAGPSNRSRSCSSSVMTSQLASCFNLSSIGCTQALAAASSSGCKAWATVQRCG